MIKTQLAIFLLVNAVISSAIAFDDQPRLYGIVRMRENQEGGGLYLIDGNLAVSVGGSNNRDSSAPSIKSSSCWFEIEYSPHGQLLVVRPQVLGNDPKAKRALIYDGWYVTGDYSTTPPTIKVTKESDEHVYWEIPIETSGPIVNQNNLGRKAYLALDDETLSFADPTTGGQIHFQKMILSPEASYKFKAKRYYPNDGK